MNQKANFLGERPYTIENLPYTTAVVREAMRLKPPIWIIERNVKRETELGGFRLPSNSSIVLPIYTLHRHAEYWNDPEILILSVFCQVMTILLICHLD